MKDLENLLKNTIRNIPDFPKKGILFRDITTLLADPILLEKTTTALTEIAPPNTTHIAAIEARGFLFGVTVAIKLGIPFVPIRKKGKLPYKTFSVEYDLEYGKDSLHIHQDALRQGSKVYLIDDLIATGGSIVASTQLIEKCGAEVIQIACIIELEDLKGKDQFSKIPFSSLLKYQ